MWEGQLSRLTRAEALETVAPLRRLRAGKKDILLIEDPTAAELQELSIYGQIRAAEAISRRRTGDWRVTVTVEELL